MRELTADTIIRVRRPRPELTGDTRIRLSQIKDLADWVEDRKYQVGEISQKTGLQKQPDGSWKEPNLKQRTRTLKSEATSSSEIKSAELTSEQKVQTKNVEDRINKAGWFKKTSSLEGMHPEAAAKVEQQCNRLFKQFPGLKGFVEGLKVETFPANEDKIYAKCEGTGKSAFIVFNKSYYENNEKLEKSYAEQVEQNYHPEGTTADSLVIHEMGHCICDYLAQKRGQDMFEFCRDVVQYTKETFEKNGIAFDVTKELGRYSTDIAACPDLDTQDAELIAEAYAEFKCSAKPRRLANFIGNLIEGELE